jgi:hypothetical protein
MTGLRETLDPKGEKRLGLTWSVLPLRQSSTLLVRTVRGEAPDNFLLTGMNQVQRSWMNMLVSITVSDHISLLSVQSLQKKHTYFSDINFDQYSCGN